MCNPRGATAFLRACTYDEFDRHYERLFVWNREKQAVVGAYRIARTDEVLKGHGQSGPYTSTLFSPAPGLLQAPRRSPVGIDYHGHQIQD